MQSRLGQQAPRLLRRTHSAQPLLGASSPSSSGKHNLQRSFWFRARASPEREPTCLYQGFSQQNEVVTVIQIPEEPADPEQLPLAGARILLLDRTCNVHSIYHPTRALTGNYWDVLSTLPSLIPAGPIGLLGLGAGTIPRIIDAHYGASNASNADASRGNDLGNRHVVHGWELDPGVVLAGRMHLGMQDLERRGSLVAYTGDALAPSASLPGGFSGVIVDLFAKGRLLHQLTERTTWESIRSRLTPTPSETPSSSSGTSPAPSGPPGTSGDTAAAVPVAAHAASPLHVPRVIANLGQSPPAAPGEKWHEDAPTTLKAYEAMAAAFEGEVSLLRCQNNILALTGPLPGPQDWPARLPEGLRQTCQKVAGCWSREVYLLLQQGAPRG